MAISNWTYHYATDDFSCDACGHESSIIYTKCPNCGAKMITKEEAEAKLAEEGE